MPTRLTASLSFKLIDRRLGSDAVESAMKLSWQYHRDKGQPRSRFISRQQSYHGGTLGALALSGIKSRREPFEGLLTDKVSHISACNPYRDRREDQSDEEYVKMKADELDAEFKRVWPEQVVAFVVEPVVGAVSHPPIHLFVDLPFGGSWMRPCRSRIPAGHEERLPQAWCAVHFRRGHVRVRPYWNLSCLGARQCGSRHPTDWERGCCRGDACCRHVMQSPCIRNHSQRLWLLSSRIYFPKPAHLMRCCPRSSEHRSGETAC